MNDDYDEFDHLSAHEEPMIGTLDENIPILRRLVADSLDVRTDDGDDDGDDVINTFLESYDVNLESLEGQVIKEDEMSAEITLGTIDTYLKVLSVSHSTCCDAAIEMQCDPLELPVGRD